MAKRALSPLTAHASDENKMLKLDGGHTEQSQYDKAAKDLVAGLRRQSKVENWSLEAFSNPQKHFEFPYPTLNVLPDKRKRKPHNFDPPYDRSESNNAGPSKLSYMGRERFRAIYEEFTDDSRNWMRHHRIYYGPEGCGKSTLFAAMAALILTTGEHRLFYIPDCEAVAASENPFEEVKKALCMTFHDKPYWQRRILDEGCNTPEKLLDVVQDYRTRKATKIIFILDQYDTFVDSDYPEAWPDAAPESTLKQKEMLCDLLLDLCAAAAYKTAYCSSGNHLKFYEAKIRAEVDSWWEKKAEGFKELEAFITNHPKRAFFEDYTGRNPLFMELALRKLSTDFRDGLIGESIKGLEFCNVFEQDVGYGHPPNPHIVEDFYRNIAASVTGTTVIAPNTAALDHRYYYFDSISSTIKASAGFVLTNARRSVYLRSVFYLSLAIVLEMIPRKKNSFEMGLAAESGCIVAIRRKGFQFNEGDVKVSLKDFTAGIFCSIPFFANPETSKNTLYITDACDIDFVIVESNITHVCQENPVLNKAQQNLYLFRVALDNVKYSESEGRLFKAWARHWKGFFSDRKIEVLEVYFIWILPSLDHEQPRCIKVAENSLVGCRHPEYTRLLMSFHDIDDTLDAALRSADAYGRDRPEKNPDMFSSAISEGT
ncbi:hypothetical protein BJ508DRAFT_309975 [Ascobolus immersus RN42]|uniref:AAA+ ATPase domain-containing protein n=1 Tax=Ascobolus immersus RN42 TaxID=1160509 RepID=A0A3N4I093_ASCIM|nr:hypothetical protein BJ508DRAFT_309975 [Ascobolus immersus RN42]